ARRANAWDARSAPLLRLSSASGAPPGEVWIRETPNGLAVMFVVAYPPPKPPEILFARNPDEMARKAYWAVWVADAAKVAMPDYGWGDQFGMNTCASYNATPSNSQKFDCAAWQAVQARYRAQLQRLFQRHWRLANDTTIETYATPAFAAVKMFASNLDQAQFAPLRPQPLGSDSGPFGWFDVYDQDAQPDHQHTQSFSVFLPWSSLPPADAAPLATVFVNFKFCLHAGLCSATAPAADPDNPTTWNALTLALPLPENLTPCAYPLQARDYWKNLAPAWYFPAADGTVSTTFALINQTAGYNYDPVGLSPIVAQHKFFSRKLGPGEYVCGPKLRFAAAGQAWDSDATVDGSHLATRSLAPGRFLLRSGPTLSTLSDLGSGQCGACLVGGYDFYLLDSKTGVRHLLNVGVIGGGGEIEDGDVVISPDWTTVTVYEKGVVTGQGPEGFLRTKNWSMTRYCWRGDSYIKCGAGPSGPPPAPRHFACIFSGDGCAATFGGN